MTRVEIMHQIAELLGTIDEAFSHMEKQLEELRYEEAVQLLEDTVEGVESIQKAVLPLINEQDQNSVQSCTKELMNEISIFLDLLKQKDHEKMETQMAESIKTAFARWRNQVEETIKTQMDH